MYKHFLKTYLLEIILFTIFLIFSTWLMFSTFSYSNGSMSIATKAWSDFANHIPLIRTFSFGSNFPPQDPLFSGEPIHYHFLFYLFVGILEKIGIRIDYALNIPSALGFFALLVMLYVFGKKIFHSSAVGILTVLFFLFNGTLSFLQFFRLHPLARNTIQTIVTNNTFPSFGPYTNTIVSAFWNLNIYTNQRHLAAAYALALFIIYILFFKCNFKQEMELFTDEDLNSNIKILNSKQIQNINTQNTKRFEFFNFPSLNLFRISDFGFRIFEQKNKTNLLLCLILGIILGLSFFFHLAVFLMTVIMLCFIFILFKNLRIASLIILCTAAILAFPQYLYLHSSSGGFSIKFVPGYLVFDHLTFINLLTYWFYNLGLHLILIPVGFILAPRN